MIDSFKNIDRLRYKINKNLEDLCNKTIERIENQNVIFMNESFCAIASAMAAFFLGESILQPMNRGVAYIITRCLEITDDSLVFISNIISAIICSICLIFFAILLNKLLKIIVQKRKNNKPEGEDKINYAKEFDNVACDCIFVSLEYKELYVRCNDLNEKTLYFLEIMHYLQKATKIIEVLCKRKELYIISRANVIGIEGYRVISVLNVMSDLRGFLWEEINAISIEQDESIKNVLDELKVKLDRLTNDIKNYIDE